MDKLTARYRDAEIQVVDKPTPFPMLIQFRNEHGSTKWLSLSGHEFHQIWKILVNPSGEGI